MTYALNLITAFLRLILYEGCLNLWRLIELYSKTISTLVELVDALDVVPCVVGNGTISSRESRTCNTDACARLARRAAASECSFKCEVVKAQRLRTILCKVNICNNTISAGRECQVAEWCLCSYTILETRIVLDSLIVYGITFGILLFEEEGNVILRYAAVAASTPLLIIITTGLSNPGRVINLSVTLQDADAIDRILLYQQVEVDSIDREGLTLINCQIKTECPLFRAKRLVRVTLQFTIIFGTI